MPRFTIIIPVYNTEKYLDQCLDSIKKQTTTDFEVIMIDDGSTDCSADICQRYASSDTRFTLIKQSNKGVSAARNAGLNEAHGEYVSFIDADDWIFEDYLQVLSEPLNDNRIDLSICFYDDPYTECHHKEDIRFTMDRVKSANFLFYTNKFGYQGYIWNKMFKRSVIEEAHIRFDENASFNEDRLFCITYICCMEGESSFWSRKIYSYRRRDGSAMTSENHSFNSNFLSDFDTSEQILYLLRSNHFPRRTINLARDRVIDSYDLIRHKMRRTHYINAIETKNNLKTRVINITGALFFLDNRIRRFINRQYHHCFKTRIYIEHL